MKAYTCLALVLFFVSQLLTAQSPAKERAEVEGVERALEYERQGKYLEAIPYVEQNMKRLSAAEDIEWLVELGQLAELHLLAGQYSEAARLYDRQWEQKGQYKQLPDTIVAKIYLQQASKLLQFSLLDSTFSLLNRALDLYQQHFPPMSQQLVATKLRLADYYEKNEQYKQAEALLGELIANLRLAKSRKKQLAEALRVLAYTYYIQENYTEAEQCYLESIALLREQKPSEMRMLTFAQNGLALTYLGQGQTKKAISIYEQINALWKELWGARHPEYAVGLYNLAHAYKQSGDLNQFEVLSEEALAIFREKLGLHHYTYIAALKTNGNAYLRIQQYEKALALFRQSLFYNCKADSSSLPEAISFFQSREFRYEGLATNTLKNYFSAVANLYFVKGKDPAYLRKSYQTLKTLLQIQQKQLISLTQEEDRLHALQSIYTYADFALDMADRIGEEQYQREAFTFTELNKSALLKSTLKIDEQYQLGGLTKVLYEEEKALRFRKLLLEKESNSSKANAAELLKRSNQLNQEIEQFKQKLKKSAPQYYQERYANDFPPIESYQAKLEEGQLMLVYYYGIRSVFLYSIDKDDFRFYKQELDMDSLQGHIEQLRHTLTDYSRLPQLGPGHDAEYAKSAYWLFDKIVALGLPKDKDYKELIIVPDGGLAHIPFEALLYSRPEKEATHKQLDYLLRHYQISYNYSAALWYNDLEMPRESQRSTLMALAATYEKGTTAEKTRSFRSTLKELPAAVEEVKALQKKYQGFFGVGEICNERVFKQQAKDYAILHLAMHGLLNKERPLLSGLAFTLTADTLEDDFLQAWEIAQMDLKAELVVLSACETGYGKFRQGEGVMSLARSFRYAGVPALLVSLWQVNDNSTSLIMQNFYAELLKGTSKAEALQQAKLGYIDSLHNDLMAHPAFWAPFIQLGNNQAVTLERKGSGSWKWWGALSLLLLLGLGLVLWRKYRKG